MQQTFFIFFGIVFILLGVIGLVLPFLQGILFLMIGVILLSLSIPAVREFRKKHSIRYPLLHAKIEELEDWLEGKLGLK